VQINIVIEQFGDTVISMEPEGHELGVDVLLGEVVVAEESDLRELVAR